MLYLKNESNIIFQEDGDSVYMLVNSSIYIFYYFYITIMYINWKDQVIYNIISNIDMLYLFKLKQKINKKNKIY